MNKLLEKFNEYKSIVNYRFTYEFSNGTSLEYRLRQTEFIHLIGLHKLVDIPIINQYNDVTIPNISAKYLISKIKKEELLTDEIVRKSSEFYKIEKRYNIFSKDNILTLSYTDVIIDFNPNIIGSSLNAKYILYEKKKEGGYNHLCIGYGNTGSYTESFFYHPTNRYIIGQNTYAVNSLKIYDRQGKIVFTDSFI